MDPFKRSSESLASADTLQTDLLAALEEHADGKDAKDSGGSQGPLGLLWRENEGLAEEVLRNYEQLNFIFDLAGQIAAVNDADGVINALLGRLARVFSAPVVCLYGADGRRRLFDAVSNQCEPVDGILGLDSSLQESVACVRREGRSIVRTVGEFQILLAGLSRLNGTMDVALVLRSAGPRHFQANDLLLAESFLSFGGQIIRNSELHSQLREVSMQITRALVAAIDKKDHYTSGHSERVGIWARLTGQEMGLPERDLQMLQWAGLLHDVGKIGVPEAILQKSGRLTTEEFDIIKQHPCMGYEILKPISSLTDVLDGVLHHHENPDGSGYPHGLKGDDIPLFARIIHVVDVYDALVSNRSYRPAFTCEGALAVMRKESGTKLDAQVVEAFLRALARAQSDTDTLETGP